MDVGLVAVAETLACEFGALRSSTVARVLDDCADEFPYGGPHFIEQAARARLSRLGSRGAGGPRKSAGDSLSVSLHDGELADEVTLTIDLMVAANESDRPLPQDQVDRILGLVPLGRVVVPAPRPRPPLARDRRPS